MARPSLRRAVLAYIGSVFRYFFIPQHRAALFPGRIPVSVVDHPLDKKVPFTPHLVGTYLDFIAFWVRMLGYILGKYGDRAQQAAEDFLVSTARLYRTAAEVYSKNLSTTERPRYFRHLRFVLIHLTDPHLMCIPSLHVMIVIWTYTKFRDIIRHLDKGEGSEAEHIAELMRGAQDITEAVLFVKQHSVNCIAAAMYAMTRFDGDLFPRDEAYLFVSELFVHNALPNPDDGGLIRDYIWDLYCRFLDEGDGASSWEAPLLLFFTSPPRFSPAAPED
jgi:hypothetical protein